MAELPAKRQRATGPASGQGRPFRARWIGLSLNKVTPANGLVTDVNIAECLPLSPEKEAILLRDLGPASDLGWRCPFCPDEQYLQGMNRWPDGQLMFRTHGYYEPLVNLDFHIGAYHYPFVRPLRCLLCLDQKKKASFQGLTTQGLGKHFEVSHNRQERLKFAPNAEREGLMMARECLRDCGMGSTYNPYYIPPSKPSTLAYHRPTGDGTVAYGPYRFDVRVFDDSAERLTAAGTTMGLHAAARPIDPQTSFSAAGAMAGTPGATSQRRFLSGPKERQEQPSSAAAKSLPGSSGPASKSAGSAAAKDPKGSSGPTSKPASSQQQAGAPIPAPRQTVGATGSSTSQTAPKTAPTGAPVHTPAAGTGTSQTAPASGTGSTKSAPASGTGAKPKVPVPSLSKEVVARAKALEADSKAPKTSVQVSDTHEVADQDVQAVESSHVDHGSDHSSSSEDSDRDGQFYTGPQAPQPFLYDSGTESDEEMLSTGHATARSMVRHARVTVRACARAGASVFVDRDRLEPSATPSHTTGELFPNFRMGDGRWSSFDAFRRDLTVRDWTVPQSNEPSEEFFRQRGMRLQGRYEALRGAEGEASSSYDWASMYVPSREDPPSALGVDTLLQRARHEVDANVRAVEGWEPLSCSTSDGVDPSWYPRAAYENSLLGVAEHLHWLVRLNHRQLDLTARYAEVRGRLATLTQVASQDRACQNILEEARQAISELLQDSETEVQGLRSELDREHQLRVDVEQRARFLEDELASRAHGTPVSTPQSSASADTGVLPVLIEVFNRMLGQDTEFGGYYYTVLLELLMDRGLRMPPGIQNPYARSQKLPPKPPPPGGSA